MFSALFSWAMAEPQLPSIDPEDESGWHLVFRQTSPFIWPRGKLNLVSVKDVDHFPKLRRRDLLMLVH